jgi:hypothetical protein
MDSAGDYKEWSYVLAAEAELDTLLERYHIPGMERRVQ